MLRDWGLEDPKTAREGTAAILEESERMRRLVESLLTLARGNADTSHELAPGDLGEVTVDATKTARVSADGKVAVEYIPPRKPVEVSFDQARIRQAAVILLDNAVRYTPEVGKIVVNVRQESGWATLEVSDMGIGIPEDELPLVFKRLYRPDQVRRAPRKPAQGSG